MHTLKKRELPSNILRYVLLLLGGAVSVMPMIYMISTSLKPNGALYEFPPKFFPALDTITIENYVYIFGQEKFYINFLNSVIVAVLTVVIAAFVSSALAFCLARFRFPGRKALFALVIGTMIIPGDAHHHAVSARLVLQDHEQAAGAGAVLCGVGHSVLHVYDQGLH